MDFYRCLDTISPTTQQILLWAYDLDMYLTEQDEDLTLLSNRYIAILLRLSCDDKCPKQHYCFSILKHHIQHLLGQRDHTNIQESIAIFDQFGIVTNTAIRDWLSDFKWMAHLVATPRELTFSEAQKIAKFIIGSENDLTTPTITCITNSGYFRYEQVFDVYRDFLYINTLTSDWKYSHMIPLDCM
ncbi:hypothetical protein [Dyadobacter aurulentus]|uniref:hypothetical protein n=1 Tax=Dyadobacter sp. UC 10 TaxID=2605428 RepID=UPI0011F2E978|nr:hypothetical protein [Dyadobacter sp. UC 10]KAA0992584.1 hypothetical protein FXO21_21625 [Dyadobacter sp. UC 10]